MQDIRTNLGAVIRNARTQQNITQDALAEMIDVDKRTILQIEAGRGNPKFETLYLIIEKLKIPADLIFHPSVNNNTAIDRLIMELDGCTDDEIAKLTPMIHYLLKMIKE